MLLLLFRMFLGGFTPLGFLTRCSIGLLCHVVYELPTDLSDFVINKLRAKGVRSMPAGFDRFPVTSELPQQFLALFFVFIHHPMIDNIFIFGLVSSMSRSTGVPLCIKRENVRLYFMNRSTGESQWYTCQSDEVQPL